MCVTQNSSFIYKSQYSRSGYWELLYRMFCTDCMHVCSHPTYYTLEVQHSSVGETM